MNECSILGCVFIHHETKISVSSQILPNIRRVGVVGVVMERWPGVSWEPIRSKVRRHAGVGGHPGIHPDPLHHLGVLLCAELWPEAVRRRSSAVSNHVPVVVLRRPVRRPTTTFVKELVSQRRHSAGNEL